MFPKFFLFFKTDSTKLETFLPTHYLDLLYGRDYFPLFVVLIAYKQHFAGTGPQKANLIEVGSLSV